MELQLKFLGELIVLFLLEKLFISYKSKLKVDNN